MALKPIIGSITNDIKNRKENFTTDASKQVWSSISLVTSLPTCYYTLILYATFGIAKNRRRIHGKWTQQLQSKTSKNILETLVNCENCFQRTRIVHAITCSHLKGSLMMQTAPSFGMDGTTFSILDGCQTQTQMNGCQCLIIPPAAIWCIGYTIHRQ